MYCLSLCLQAKREYRDHPKSLAGWSNLERRESYSPKHCLSLSLHSWNECDGQKREYINRPFLAKSGLEI